MTFEMTVTDVRAKRRVLNVLEQLGHEVSPGPVRASAPFSVLVSIDPADLAAVHAVARSVDPGVSIRHDLTADAHAA